MNHLFRFDFAELLAADFLTFVYVIATQIALMASKLDGSRLE